MSEVTIIIKQAQNSR